MPSVILDLIWSVSKCCFCCPGAAGKVCEPIRLISDLAAGLQGLAERLSVRGKKSGNACMDGRKWVEDSGI